MIKNKFTINKTPFSFKFIPFYFLFIIIFITSIFQKIDIDIYLKNTGVIKVESSLHKEDIVFSDYNGVVLKVLKNEGDTVTINEPLLIIASDQDENNENSLNKKIIYSNINAKIETIYIQNGNTIVKNKKLIKFYSNNEKKYYIESLFDTSEIQNITENQIVYVENIEHNVFIGKIKSIYPHKINKSKHYIKVEIIEKNEKIKENEVVNISIITKNESFIYWFLRNII